MESNQENECEEERIVKTVLCESCQRETDLLKEKLQKMIEKKKTQVAQLEKDIEVKKDNMRDLMTFRRSLCDKWNGVLSARGRIRLLRVAYENEKMSLQQEFSDLLTLHRSNTRRDKRLSRVRSKDFVQKEKLAQQGYFDIRKLAISQMVELQVCRRKLLTELLRGVFPIEVEPLSMADAGEEDYQESVHIDCDSVMEVDDGWMLSGAHSCTLPNMHIVTASMPSDGNYSAYLKAVSERSRAHIEAAQKGVPVIREDEKVGHPFKNSYLSTPAGLVFAALFADAIANTLDQPLPYPMSKRVAIGEFGNPNRRKRDFLNSVAKLDDNIMYLSFAQNVPLTALSPGHMLQNLLALVTHTQLGRIGAFECHPNLLRYKGRNDSPSNSPLSQDVEDSEPPNVAYAIDQKNLQHHAGYADSENDEIDSDTNDYDSSDFYYRDEQKQKEMEEFEEAYDWEYLEPSLKELRMFEEEQMKALLAVNSDSKTSQHHLQVANEMDVHRDRLRRLDYGSTYLDYVAMSSRNQSSSSTERTVHSSQTESSRILSPEGSSAPEDSVSADGSGGFFGTLGSLWTSAFGGRPSSS